MVKTHVTFDPRITMPISEAIHELILACGYTLTKQELLHLEYEKDEEHRLIFGFGLRIRKETHWREFDEDRGPGWYPDFNFSFNNRLTDTQLMEILNATGAIDITGLPDFKAMVQTAYNLTRKRKAA